MPAVSAARAAPWGRLEPVQEVLTDTVGSTVGSHGRITRSAAVLAGRPWPVGRGRSAVAGGTLAGGLAPPSLQQEQRACAPKAPRPLSDQSPAPVQRHMRGGESACRPGSVRPLARAGGHPSGTAVAGSLVRSTREHRAGSPRSLAQARAAYSGIGPLDLAPGGVYRAAAVTCGAGGLLHHRFTLTVAARKRAATAVCFLWHCPAGHPGSVLPTTLPCGARTFLTGPRSGATARPTHPLSHRIRRRAPRPGLSAA